MAYMYAVIDASEDLRSAKCALQRALERPIGARRWRSPTQFQKLDIQRAMRAIAEAQYLLNRLEAGEKAA